MSVGHCGAARWGGGSRELEGQCMGRKVRSTEDAFQAVNDAGMHMHNWGNQKLKCGAFLFKAVVCCSWGQVYILKTKKKPITA